MRRHLIMAGVAVVATVVAAWADFVVEDWSKHPSGTKGVPPGWEKQNWGSPKYDFTIVDLDGRRVLHLKSNDEGSTISKAVKGKVDLRKTPILEWSWKPVVLPKNGNSCKKELDDQAAQIFVAWRRFPELVRSRVIGYVWDSTQPAGTICKSEKTGTVTYIVMRSGAGELNKWITERRNVRDDFRKLYGDDPDEPDAVSISIDSNDTKSSAESYIGTIVFKER